MRRCPEPLDNPGGGRVAKLDAASNHNVETLRRELAGLERKVASTYHLMGEWAKPVLGVGFESRRIERVTETPEGGLPAPGLVVEPDASDFTGAESAPLLPSKAYFLGQPGSAYVVVEVPVGIGLVTRGHSGYKLVKAITSGVIRGMARGTVHEQRVKVAKVRVAQLNKSIGVSPAQAAAASFGSMFGWDKPGANPAEYDESGAPRTGAKHGKGSTMPAVSRKSIEPALLGHLDFIETELRYDKTLDEAYATKGLGDVAEARRLIAGSAAATQVSRPLNAIILAASIKADKQGDAYKVKEDPIWRAATKAKRLLKDWRKVRGQPAVFADPATETGATPGSSEPFTMQSLLDRIRRNAGRKATFHVAPRYCGGSPAMVPIGEAVHWALNEVGALNRNLTGVFGEENKRRAEQLGLAGIAYARWEAKGETWRYDILGDTMVQEPPRLDSEEESRVRDLRVLRKARRVEGGDLSAADAKELAALEARLEMHGDTVL